MMVRARLTCSSVAAICAKTAGGHWATTETEVPNSTRLVTAAVAASSVHGSSPGACLSSLLGSAPSPTHRECAPAASYACASARNSPALPKRKGSLTPIRSVMERSSRSTWWRVPSGRSQNTVHPVCERGREFKGSVLCLEPRRHFSSTTCAGARKHGPLPRTRLREQDLAVLSSGESALADTGEALVRLSKRGELVGRADQCRSDPCIVSGVPRIVNHHQLRARPGPAEVPRPGDRRLKVKTSVHHDPGDAGQRVGPAEQAAVLEPYVVPNIVGDEAREGHRECGIGEPRGQSRGRRPRRRGGLPQAPLHGGAPANGGV